MLRKTIEYVLVVVVAACAARFAELSSLAWGQDRIVPVASTFASVAGAVIGFVVAALAILLTIVDRTLVKNMISTGYFRNLLFDLVWTASWYGACLFAAVTVMFMDGRSAAWGLGAAVFFFVVANTRLLRAGRHLVLTLVNLK